MREESETFLNWQSFQLSEKKSRNASDTPRLGNAFCVISDKATYHYKLAYEGNYADVEKQFTVPWNDDRLNIAWPIADPILSERDRRLENADNRA